MDAFLVRVWRSDDDGNGAAGTLRGTVEHVRTHRSTAFQSTEDLVGFLTAEPDEDAVAPAVEDSRP